MTNNAGRFRSFLRKSAKAMVLLALILVISVSAWWNAQQGDRAGIYALYLFAVPILIAAFFYGRSGGLLTALVASLVALGQIARIWYPDDVEATQQLMFLIILFNLIALVTSELAEREQRQRKDIQRRARQIRHLYQASQSVMLELELDADPLRFTTARAAELVNARYAALVLYDKHDRLNHFVTNLTPEEEAQVGAWPQGQGLLGLPWQLGQVLRLDDLTSHPDFTGFPSDHPQVESLMSVPLVGRRGLVGRFFLGDKIDGPFTQEDEHLLLTFAANVATTVENSTMYQTVHRRAKELTALIEIDRDISMTLDMTQVLKRIAGHAQKIIGAEDSDIYLLEPLFAPGADTLHAVVSLSQYAEEIMATPIKIGTGIVGSVAQRGQAEIISDAAQDPRSVQIPGTPMEPESLLCAPLVIQDHVIGVMVLSRMGEGEFAETDLDFLVSLAQQASIAIHNAWLFERATRRTQEWEALHQTTLDLAAQLEMPRLLTTIARRAADLLGLDGSAIYLLEPAGQSLCLVAVHNIPADLAGTRLLLGEGGAGRVAQSGEPLVIDDYRVWPGRADVYQDDLAGSVLEVPVKWGERLVGVVSCHTAAGEQRSFGPNDVRLLQSFAQQVAVAVENARLFQVEKQRTQELSDALAQQKELDRLETEFIQNVSHELRTPLALIRGYAEMLDSGALGELADEHQEPIAIIARRARTLGDLVEDITTILEMEGRPIEQAPVNLHHIVVEAVDDFQTWAQQKQISLTSHFSGIAANSVVTGEGRQLRKVVDNLIGNALKFTPQAGQIRVELAENDTGLTLNVRDTGIGIPAGKLDRVFERFFQVDGSVRRRYGGTGLGLALAKDIVEAHSGTIKVESAKDQGSTFSVWLPKSLSSH